MAKNNFLLQITNSIWLIEPSAITSLGPVVRNLLQHNPEAFSAEVKKAQVQIYNVESAAVLPGYYSGFENAPYGSIAIIDVCGVMMKEDNCGDPGTASLGYLAKEADANKNIIATIFRFDSPGGSVSGTEDFSNIIKNMKKPTIGFVSGYMCSAAYWAGSSCDEIYISGKTDMVGSIGTMLSFEDAQPMWEKEGVVFHELYADASTDKNQDFIQARKGNYDLVKKNILNPLNNVFLSAVKKNRGEKLNAEETLSGKVFLGSKAVTAGLADGIKTFDQVIDRAQELSNQSNNNSNPQSTMKIKAGLTAIAAFLVAQFPGFKAEETVLTEEHMEKMNAELATLEAVKTELATVKKDLETANAAKETAATALATATETLATKETKITGLTAEVARLGALNPGATQTTKIGDDDAGASEKTDAQKVIDALPHNQSLDNDPRFNGSAKSAEAKK